MRKLLLALMIVAIVAFNANAAFVTVADKSTSDSLTAAEFNQILDAIKDGTLDLNTGDLTATAINIGATEITSAELGILNTYAGIDPAANVQSILGAADYAAIRGLLDLEAGTDFYSVSAADLAFQPLESTLTDIADGTIAENLVNTANPWADNEVVDALTISGGTINNSVIGGSTPAAGAFTSITASTTLGVTGVSTLTGGVNTALAEGQLIDAGITMSAGVDEGIVVPTYADVAPSTEKNYLAYDAANNKLMVREAGGWIDTSAAAGASADNDYITAAAEGNLTSESVFTDGYAIDHTDAGGDGGAFTVAFDPTEVSADGSDTWSDGSQASIAWTFDVSGTDHTMTAGDGLMTFGDAVTVTDLLTASAGITVATGQAVTVGVVQWDNGSDAIDGEVIADDTIDDDAIDLTDFTLADLTFDVGSVSTTEFGYLNGVTSAIQDQLDARALESVVGTSLNADDLTNNAGVLELVAEIPHIDAAQNWSADQEFQDNIPVSFGNDNDFEIAYDTDLSNDDAGDNDFAAGTFTGGGLKISTNSASDIPILLNNSGTGGVSLYVEKVYYTDSINYVGTDSFVSKLGANAGGVSPDAGSYWHYFDNGVLSWSENGAEKRAAKLEDAQTFTGAKTFNDILIQNGATSSGHLEIYEDTDDGTEEVTIQAQAMTADWDFTLPPAGGSSGEALVWQADGTTDWGSVSASANTDGGAGAIQLNDSGTSGSDLGLTFNETTDALTIGEAGQDGSIILYNELGATDYNHTIAVNGAQTGAITTTLPATTGTLLNNALTNTYIFVGSAGGVATGVQMSGDATMANTGALTIANDAVTMAKLDEDGNFTDWVGNWTWDTGTFLLENGFNLGSGGVVFSDDGDGQLTITGAGDGYDENLTINLDDTENTAVVGSGTGVADISYGSINLITTGHVNSGTRFIETTTDINVTVDGSSGIYINNHASAITYTLPADPETAGGDSKIFIFRNRQANAITITPAAGDVIELDGADETAGETIVSTGAIGEMATLVGFDDGGTDRWIVFSTNGTWDGGTD